MLVCRTARTWLRQIATAGTILLVTSCGSERRPACYPVHGTATYQNKPAAKAVVVLRPVSAGESGDVLPHAEVAEDGSFRIGTFEADDGAPAGDYVLTVAWPESRIDRAGDEISVDRLKGRFSDPAKSRWKVTIREGENQLNPIQLD